jgi:hypothetical protein
MHIGQVQIGDYQGINCLIQGFQRCGGIWTPGAFTSNVLEKLSSRETLHRIIFDKQNFYTVPYAKIL